MKPDPYGTDTMRIIADLRRDLDRLTAEVKQRAGVPITQASAPFLIPSASTPAAPPSGALLYVSGGQVFVRSSSLHYSTLPPELPQAAEVDPADPIVSGSGPASYNQTWGINMYNGLVNVKDTLNAALTSLKNADIMLG